MALNAEEEEEKSRKRGEIVRSRMNESESK